MSIEENKAMEQRIWEELLNGGKTEKMNELITIDYVYHGPGKMARGRIFNCQMKRNEGSL